MKKTKVIILIFLLLIFSLYMNPAIQYFCIFSLIFMFQLFVDKLNIGILNKLHQNKNFGNKFEHQLNFYASKGYKILNYIISLMILLMVNGLYVYFLIVYNNKHDILNFWNTNTILYLFSLMLMIVMSIFICKNVGISIEEGK